MKNLSSLTIQDVEKNNDLSIFVINAVKPKGDISFAIKGDDNEIVSVVIPKTWIPIDLTAYANKQSILRSTHFRRLVSKGVIKIISNEEASTILSEPDANEEVSRLTKSVYSENLKIKKIENSKESVVRKGDIEILPYNASMVSIMSREDLNDSEKMQMLRSIEDELEKKDFEWLLSNASIKKIRKWARNMLKGDNNIEE